MGESKKIQMYTDRACTIEANPETSAKCVTLSDGLDLESVLKHDLTAPKVAHEETSFKVGKGDIDVSASVVDGESSKFVIKGKTYQNILPEPSLRNGMKNGKSMQKFNEGYDNVSVIDGVNKSAILKGQTLVNIKTFHNPAPTTGSWFVSVSDMQMLKPNTKYFVKVKNKTNTGVRFYANTTTGSCQEFDAPAHSYGWTIFTTTDTLPSEVLLRLRSSDTTVTGFSCETLLIEYKEGMENWNIPYFTGMTSCKMPVLSSVGKNLVKMGAEYVDFIRSGVTMNTESNGIRANGVSTGAVDIDYFSHKIGDNTIYIDIKPNTSYKISCIVREGELIGQDPYPAGKIIADDGTERWVGSTFTTGSNERKINRIRVAVQKSGCTFKNFLFSMQLEEGSVATPHEPYKSNILSTPSNLILRGIGDVKDTLNVNTKEVVQRIGTDVLDGKTGTWHLGTSPNIRPYVYKLFDGAFTSDKFKIIADRVGLVGNTPLETECISTLGYDFGVRQLAYFPPMSITTKEDMLSYLAQNPITIQYPLVQEAIKTVDLSSFGNWEKVVLDGSQPLSVQDDGGVVYYTISIDGILPLNYGGKAVASKILSSDKNVTNNKYTIMPAFTVKKLCFSLDGKMTSNEASNYLTQNPIAVWYQTTTSQANSIKEMLSLSNGHIQLSSGVENSLIPSIDYEVPTSNSYHLDLAKVSTKYTMKNMSGTFIIDGTQYNASTNGAFTTPSTMTNKLMVTSAIQSNAMLLEGDVTTKTIPYFKGIRSSFENCDKIEVLSTGKNLFDGKFEMGAISASGSLGDSQYAVRTVNYIRVKPTTHYRVKINEYVDGGLIYIHEYDRNKNVVKEVSTTLGFVSSSETHYVKINTHNREDRALTVDSTMQFEETTSISPYELYKSNDVKIPLLHPLRSLPNGVYDEVIIDRMYNKATIIKRIGQVIFNGGEVWSIQVDNTLQTNTIMAFTNVADNKLLPTTQANNTATDNLRCDAFPINSSNGLWTTDKEGISKALSSKFIRIRIIESKLATNDVNGLNSYLALNPMTLYYELATPIITEVDIEGFPYVYKNGHIFLNSEIAPQVEIVYTSNQTQQIKANNETLIRHEIDIDSLDELIAGFIEADYQLRLFQFDYGMLKMKRRQ